MRKSYWFLKHEQERAKRECVTKSKQTLITFIVFQGEVGINLELAGQSEGEPLSVGKVILVHCRDRLDHLLVTRHGINDSPKATPAINQPNHYNHISL